MTAIRGLAILLLLQVAGEALVRVLHLPFPGPVVGMVLLLLVLAAAAGPGLAAVRDAVAAAADALLAHLSLLFVPVGVGVVAYIGLVTAYGLRLALVIVVSTWIGMAVTALVLRALLQRGDGTTGEGTGG